MLGKAIMEHRINNCFSQQFRRMLLTKISSEPVPFSVYMGKRVIEMISNGRANTELQEDHSYKQGTSSPLKSPVVGHLYTV